MKDLVDLTQMAWQAKQAELQSIRRREALIRDALHALKDRQSPAFQTESEAGDAGLLARADLAWQRWKERESRRLNIELALVMAELAEGKARTKRAFGRHQVMQKLAQKIDHI
ncbi:hypothetical protein AAD018_000375 [Aestuariibius insulae]|uniref:hypothetical protein n=1 Tax=Aestuariibius insulae TaxID=2058287 RepID=UPI00345F1529